MKEITYSKNIADMISKYLTRTRCQFSFEDRLGRFQFSVNLRGRIKKADYTINVRKEQYTVYAVPSIYVNANNREKMTAMAEFICQVNNRLANGNFELDMKDGEIRYKYFVNCIDSRLTAETVEDSICIPGAMLNRYGDGITDIISDDAAAEEAHPWRKRPPVKGSGRQTSQCTDDDSEEYDHMMARLRGRLGITEEEVSKKAAWDAEMPEHVKIDLFGAKGGAVS